MDDALDVTDTRESQDSLDSPESLDSLVAEWLTLPDVAERLGLDVGKVRRLLQDRCLVATRRGERNVLSVPAALIVDGAPLPDCAAP